MCTERKATGEYVLACCLFATTTSCKISFLLVSVAYQTDLSLTKKNPRQVSREKTLMYLATKTLFRRQVYGM